jgi:phosphoglycerate kinase
MGRRGMTFTFVKALGGKIGDSICEDDKMELALEILKKLKKKEQIHIQLIWLLLILSNDAQTQIVDVREIPRMARFRRRTKIVRELQESNNGI